MAALQDLPAVIVAIIALQYSRSARWAHSCVDFCGQGKADAVKFPCKSESFQNAQSLLAQAKALHAWQLSQRIVSQQQSCK